MNGRLFLLYSCLWTGAASLLVISAYAKEQITFDTSDLGTAVEYINSANAGLLNPGGTEKSCSAKNSLPISTEPLPTQAQCSFESKKMDGKNYLEFRWYISNDNLLLGSLKRIRSGKPDGNDFGLTNLMKLGVTHKKGSLEYSVDVTSGIYSVRSQIENGKKIITIEDTTTTTLADGTILNNGTQTSTTTSVLPTNGDPTVKPQSFIDVTEFVADLKKDIKGHPSFFVRGVLGGQIRQQNPDKTVPAAKLQNAWHYRFVDSSFLNMAPGQTLQADKNTNVTHTQSTDTLANGNTLHHKTTTSTLTQPSRVSAFNPKDEIASYSVMVGGGVGTTKEFFSGTCTVSAEGGALISTEGGRSLIGLNSNAYLKVDTHTVALRKKNNTERLTLDLGAALFYFPAELNSTSQNIGADAHLGLEFIHYLGKKKRITLRPFMTLLVPVGRQFFQEYNDLDPIGNMGIRLRFDR